MSQRLLWLLVEWVEKKDVFPKYGVVNVGSLIGKETELREGKLIFVRNKHCNSAKRAQILRISDDKRYIKDQKALLEREDGQMKNVLSICMRTIREMKSESTYTRIINKDYQNGAGPSSNNSLPHVVADNETSSDESNSDDENRSTRTLLRNNEIYDISRKSVNSPFKSFENVVSYMGLPNNQQSRRSHSIYSSTPLIKNKETNILVSDKATQTEAEAVPPTEMQMEQMRIIINQLYRRFLSLVSRVQSEPAVNRDSITNSPIPSDSEQNCNEMYMEKRNDGSGNEKNNDTSSVDTGVGNNSRGKKLRVRRVSAHTTNCTDTNTTENGDLVPIGQGHALVPKRLLNDLNWKSYTSVTRKLLQAIFPRRVLATHSLTGKPSPAFLNKPAKKCLDPNIVGDIVDTVSERCNVPKNVVRGIITTKCTDEAKLYRNRQLYKKSTKKESQENQENMPPVSPTSENSSNTSD